MILVEDKEKEPCEESYPCILKSGGTIIYALGRNDHKLKGIVLKSENPLHKHNVVYDNFAAHNFWPYYGEITLRNI